jgi:hypothetical protein
MKQKRQVLWYLVALGFIILFVLMLLSSVLEVGDRLANIHPYVSYVFYVLVFLIVYILLLRPINIIAFKKPLRLHLDKEALELKDYQKMKSILLDLPYVTDELKTQLKEAKTIETLPTLVDDTMNKVVKKEVMNNIKTHAKASTQRANSGRLRRTMSSAMPSAMQKSNGPAKSVSSSSLPDSCLLGSSTYSMRLRMSVKLMPNSVE